MKYKHIPNQKINPRNNKTVPDNPELSIIIPTYNEVSSIGQLVARIRKVVAAREYEIIIVDDDSQDGTQGVVAQLSKQDPHVRYVIRHECIRDLGKSILLGIRQARGDIIVGMDADGNHDPALLPHLTELSAAHDMVIGSRYISGGGMQSTYRYVTSSIVNWVMKRILRVPVRDLTSGYYAVRRDKLLRLPVGEIYQGYGEYHIRLVYAAHTHAFHIREIPAYFYDRSEGKSKSNFIHMFFAYLSVARNLPKQFNLNTVVRHTHS